MGLMVLANTMEGVSGAMSYPLQICWAEKAFQSQVFEGLEEH